MRWWRFVIAAEFRKILAFRVDFWMTLIGQTVVQLFIARALWENIFEASGNKIMEGYTLPMMTLYYLIVPIGNRILMGENIGFLSREIYDGSFTRYLIYPISFFQYKGLTYLTHSLFYCLQLVLIVSLYQLTSLDIGSLFWGILLFLMAALTYALLSIMIELISLWADNIWSLMVMMRFIVYFFGGSFVPIEFFPTWIQETLQYTPFPYLVSLPVRTVMGLTNMNQIFTGMGVLAFWSLVAAGAAKLIWSRGQHRYTGVGI